MNSCAYCSEKAKLLCTYNTVYVCNNHVATHLNSPGPHNLKSLEVPEEYFDGKIFEENLKKSHNVTMAGDYGKNFLKNNYGLLIEGHINWVKSVAITSDNKYAVSGSFDKTVRIWNLQEKRQEAVLEGHTSHV